MGAGNRSRVFAFGALAVLALGAGACAHRYAPGLSVAAPPRVIESTPLPTIATPTPAVTPAERTAARTPKSPVVRSRPAARDTGDDAVGTTGAGLAAAEPPPSAGTPVVTVTTTPGSQAGAASNGARSLTTVVMQTLRRPVAAVPLGAGFAASAVLSVALYRRRHRIPG